MTEENPRMKRLISGNWQFGHAGEHRGNGTDGCPQDLHHHHDIFCKRPTFKELWEAGIKPAEFRERSRR
jgi:hypothetical protein